MGGVQIGHALADDAKTIHHRQVLYAQVQQVLANGNTGRARAVDDDLDVADLLFNDLQGVNQRGSHHDGSAMLVVMEYGDIADFLQLAFYLETAGSADIFQVDAAKAAGNQVDGAYQLVNILAADADGERIHIGKGLEQGALALHNGHAGFGADIAQAQNGGAVGDNGHQVVAAGQLIALVIIVMDHHARLGNAGGVSQGQILTVVDGAAINNLNLAVPLIVLFQRFLSDIHGINPQRGSDTGSGPAHPGSQ